MSLDVWIGISIALAPTFLMFVCLARAKRSMWVAFAIGAIGWIIAGYVRSPILAGIIGAYGNAMAQSLSFFILSAAFAGLFEEGIKYGLMRGSRARANRSNARPVAGTGLGLRGGRADLCGYHPRHGLRFRVLRYRFWTYCPEPLREISPWSCTSLGPSLSLGPSPMRGI